MLGEGIVEAGKARALPLLPFQRSKQIVGTNGRSALDPQRA